MAEQSPPVAPDPDPLEAAASSKGASRSRLALASFILSFVPVLGILNLGGDLPPAVVITLWLLPVLSAVGAIIALKRIRMSGGRLRGRRLAIASLTLAIVLSLLCLLAHQAYREWQIRRELARQLACAANLKQMGVVFKKFAADASDGLWPPLSPEEGHLMCTAKAICPQYLADPRLLFCPSDARSGWPEYTEDMQRDPESAFADSSYVYLGYVIMSDEEIAAFTEIYKQRVAQGLGFEEDLDAPPGRGSMGTDTFYRLRNGVERAFLKDKQDAAAAAEILSRIPVMWDAFCSTGPFSYFNHIPGGSNVLYMDGHVEFIRFPSGWPVTKRVAEITGELASPAVSWPPGGGEP
ncbi:MAG TPA: DUF4190 domain-containing protein [Candidatus Hydrogenedentes bacterium]|nr:DUF4190 domain-containing protein [Candidatus Hydrogenedentota bacterium]